MKLQVPNIDVGHACELAAVAAVNYKMSNHISLPSYGSPIPVAASPNFTASATPSPKSTSNPDNSYTNMTSQTAIPQALLFNSSKDSRWLTLEVCREFQRNRCTRTEEECKFAHPPPHVDQQNGRVMCCFDSIKMSLLAGSSIDAVGWLLHISTHPLSTSQHILVG
ncbi:hypothetical protein EB796_014681 [Bugula neritina]|uniref:C3H1-type domain-containing protein n=1 Tax=Bugula neritina TaxID=10212 RepID=A0A7J7JNJ9_BUGNE|nr:hypothetical protein EB796_014681 [Bugula neritina]